MASDKDSYLTVYRQFFEDFAATVNPNDPLPVRLASYKFNNDEIAGGVVDWTLQYLNQKQCPSSLVAPLIKTVIDEIKQMSKKQPTACGFSVDENVYEPLRLMQVVMSKANEVCLRYLDNSALDELPPPPTPGPFAPPIISVCAAKNCRRRMEDRHVTIDDLNTMFNIQDASPASYYAIFDGHSGPQAAMYSAAHLHQYFAESLHYPTDIENAFREAFLRTDSAFLEKKISSGTTAVCALLRRKHNMLYVAWAGDSLALIVKGFNVLQIVKPHKPTRQDEQERIEAMGGVLLHYGTLRVNGQLAVSRAIGDPDYKPYVTSEPDIAAVPLDGREDFLILACDGLFDFVAEDDAAIAVYKHIYENPDDIVGASQKLVQLAKINCSTDNISVIVIFLRDPHQIRADTLIASKLFNNDLNMEMSLDNSNNMAAANNPFMMNNSNQKTAAPPTEILFDDTTFAKQNGGNKLPEQESPSNDLYDYMSQTTNNLTKDETDDQSPQNNELYDFMEKTGINVKLEEATNDYDYLQRPATNGKRSADEFEEEDEELDVDTVDDEDDDDEKCEDFGPETDVDAENDILLSPSIAAAKALSEGIITGNNNAYEMKDNRDVDSEEDDEMIIKDVESVEDKEIRRYEEEMELQRQQTSEFDHPAIPKREAREETPTPPAHAVLDNSSGAHLTDNVAESGGEESDEEDEWNYIRVDQKENEQKSSEQPVETQQTIEEVCQKELTLEETDDDMASQLNPDAAEFVPSPVRTHMSPPLRDILLDEAVLAQSPHKPVPMAATTPSPDEFLIDMSKRPKDVESEDEAIANGDYDEDAESNARRQKDLENLLNGKNIDEIQEFNPKSPVPHSKDSTEAEENAESREGPALSSTNLLDQSEAFSTKAEFGDETTTSFMDSDFQKTAMESSLTDSTHSSQVIGADLQDFIKSDFVPDFSSFKPQDPMSTSYYQDRDEESNEFNHNPFDLNAVQTIPDDIDDMIEAGQNKVSDLDADVMNAVDEIQSAVREAEKAISDAEEKEQESPIVEHKLEDLVCALQKQHDEGIDVDTKSPVPDNDAVFQREEVETADIIVHEEVVQSPVKSKLDFDAFDQPILSPEPVIFDQINTVSDVEEINQIDFTKEPTSPVHLDELISPPKSTEPTELISPPQSIELIESKSPEPELISPPKSTEPLNLICTSKSPEPVELISPPKSIDPIELICSETVNENIYSEHELLEEAQEIKQETMVTFDDIADKVFVPEPIEVEFQQTNLDISSPIIEGASPVLDFAREVGSPIEDVPKSPVDQIADPEIHDTYQVSDFPVQDIISCAQEFIPPVDTSVKSAISSVGPDLGSFLTRSPVPDLASPLSAQTELNESETVPKYDFDRPLYKCVYPLRTQSLQSQIEEFNLTSGQVEHSSSELTFEESIKSTETPPSTPAVLPTETTQISISPEPQKLVEAVERLTEIPEKIVEESTSISKAATMAAVAGATTIASTAIATSVLEKKPSTTTKSKTATTTTKKLTTKTPTSPSKVSAAPIKRTTTAPAAKLGTTKPASTTTKPIPKLSVTSSTTLKYPSTKPAAPRPKPISSPKTVAEKKLSETKPLLNGDAKSTVKLTSTVRKVTSTTTRTPLGGKPATESIMKTTNARPTTAPAKTSTLSPRPTSATTPKPRPTSLTSKMTNGVASKTTSITKTSSTATKSPTTKPSMAATKPKSAGTTLPPTARPRTLLATKTTTSPKVPPIEKQVKETTNKQLSARTTTTRTSSIGGTRTTSTVKKTETKSPVTKTTRTTTTTLKSSAGSKKPTSVTRTSLTKTETLTTTNGAVQNGTVTVVQQITDISVGSDEPQLLKDSSPVVDPIAPIDNLVNVNE